MPDILAEQKAEWRAQMRAVRKAAHAKAGPSLYASVAAPFLNGLEIEVGTIVAAYWPTGSEFDPRPLMEAIVAAGAKVALPVIEGEGMVFRAWQPGDLLEAGRHGILAPTQKAELLQPHFIITPLLAMDIKGHRLGQGGGYYDRVLAALRVDGPLQAVIGLGFNEQLVDNIPHEGHDARLDYVLTPRQFLAVGD